MDAARPSLDDFLRQLTGLSSSQGRELAEIPRVPDWRRDRDIRNFVPTPGGSGAMMGYKQIAAEDAARTEAALDDARRIIGQEAVSQARGRAAAALADRHLSWPGMRSHLPAKVVLFGALAGAALLFLRNPWSAEQPWFAIFVLLAALAFVAWLVGYLLPPGEGDLRWVVEHAAVAHAAGPDLSGEHFDQLAGGWYAVLEGSWRRGRRPYLLWGCVLSGTLAVVLLGILMEAAGALK
jgi:hypothetical protein